MLAVKKDDYVTRAVAGETLLLPVKSGVASLDSIYTLNEVGGAIWELIDGRRTTAEIADEISRRFEVDAPTASADVDAFLADLVEAGLVAEKGSPMIETRSYTEFTTRFHTAIAGARIPLSGTVEVSHRCPLACQHCYNNLPMNDAAARAAEMTTADHMRLVDELVDMGCLWLLYTGGEIFARSDFLDIYTHAKQRGLMLTLFTNGTLINERIADRLAEYRPFGVEITLYGGTRETYERMTQVPGSFDRCHRGIELLLERGLPLALKTVATRVTLSEIPIMRQFAKDRGLEFTYEAMMNPRIDCGKSPLAVRISPDEVVALDLLDPERETEWRRFNRVFQGPKIKPRDGNPAELYTCGGGVNSFAVDPAGMLSICVLSHVDKYDVRRGSFRDGWDHFLRNVRAKPISRPTKCTECHLIAMCGMCPANGELENGDPEKPVDFCATSPTCAMALDQGVPPHGACEYCPGGSRYAQVERSLKALETAVSSGGSEALWEGRLAVGAPPVEESGCGSGGCGGCGPIGIRR